MTEDVNMTEGLDEEYNTGGMDGLVERIVLERVSKEVGGEVWGWLIEGR